MRHIKYASIEYILNTDSLLLLFSGTEFKKFMSERLNLGIANSIVLVDNS